MPNFDEVTRRQREFFAAGGTLSLAFRRTALMKLKESIAAHEADIAQALKKDLGKSPFEAYEAETGIILDELGFTLWHLKKWATPRRVRTPVVHFPSSCRIEHEPYGLVLIMSPWNYPFQLTMAPLVGAIAAGNCAVVKPSAYSPATSAVIARLVEECFDPVHVAVIQGGREENKALLQQRFDYIFFTGSVAVGRQVMEAASHSLTPLTLELGGKSPCIVCADVDIDLAARRIIWGKTLNAGQTCVAPDYVLVHRSAERALVERMKHYIRRFFGDAPLMNDEFPRIVSEKHFQRVSALLGSGKVEAGGATDAGRLKIEPTLLTGVTWDMPVMQEEIFGPVLPVLPFDDLDADVIGQVNSRPKPLALYLFTTSKKTESHVIERVSFGSGCVNDTIVQLASNYMPFGGVGQSGMGGYHGKWSFDTFTHEKSILKKSNRIDVPLRYPPYGDRLGLLRKLLK